MRFLRFLAMGVLAIGSIGVTAHAADALPAYKPEQSVSGTIRIWGHDYMSAVTQYWARGFQRFHPEARFEIVLKGSAAATPGLYSGAADIALLGRENNVTDDNGFGRVKQYKPLRLELMGGSLDQPGKSDALVVFVHRDNPLARMTLAQLDAVFGHEHRQGMGGNLRMWDELGVGGEWAGRPIRLYAYHADTGAGEFFRNTALLGSHKMNWDNLTEYRDRRRSDGTVYRSAEQIIDALRQDRYGMAISSLRFAHAEVKPIALAAHERGAYFQATRASLVARDYPLARRTYAFVDKPPGKPLDPKVKEFLRYVLSDEGQADVVRDHGYLPLNREVLATQLARLEKP